MAGIRSGNLTDFLRSSFCNDFTAFIAALWTEIDNVVSYFCHIEIMFDNDNCIPLIDQLLQYDKQFAYPEAFKANVKMPPMGHYGNAELEIGRVCVQLAMPDFKFMSGETLTLEGGMGQRP